MNENIIRVLAEVDLDKAGIVQLAERRAIIAPMTSPSLKPSRP
jgi:hypothetical protein